MSSVFFETSTRRKLHCLQSGDCHGPLVICLHGLGGSINTFTPILSQIPQSCRIILLDFPGFGKSPPPTDRPTVPSYVADLHDIIASLQGDTWKEAGTQKVTLIGHSLGSAIALHFAVEFPSRIAGLVLIGSARSASHIPVARQRMQDMAANTRKMGMTWAAQLASTSNFSPAGEYDVEERLRKEVYDAVVSSDAESYALTCEMMVDESHKDPDYSVLRCPTLLIAGDHDVISPVERSRGLVELIGSEICWVEILKTGHQPILEEPDKVSNLIVNLLQKIPI